MPADLTKIRAMLASVAGFTAGPWRVIPMRPEDEEDDRIRIIDSNGDDMITDSDGGSSWECSEPEMFAAAPDLHRHLTEAVGEIERLAERVVGVEARIADAVAADRAALGEWLRERPGIAYLANAIERGDHIDDDKPPLPSLRMTLLLRDELLRQVETLTAERDRRIDPVEHARAVMRSYMLTVGGAVDEGGARWRWGRSPAREELLARVGADVLAEVER